MATATAKIDYYNCDLSGHSEDAADPQKTCRVMTIMLAEEYLRGARCSAMLAGPSFCSRLLVLGEKRAREELVVLLFVELGTFDVEKFQAWHAHGERQRIDRQLRDRLVGARIGFVIKDVHGIVAHLQKVDVACDAARRPTRRELDAVARFEFADLVRRSARAFSGPRGTPASSTGSRGWQAPPRGSGAGRPSPRRRRSARPGS